MQLTPRLLLAAYCKGVFPMAHEDGQIYWYDPDPRAIIPLPGFYVPHRLTRLVRRGVFEVRVDTAFTAVMQACATPTSNRDTTWISDELIGAYTALHRLGFAHSVECWQDGRLVGGLYGVTVQGLFAGESMFSRARDSSKVALVHLVRRLRAGGFQLLDIQFLTEHLQQFGAIEISAAEYKRRLAHTLLFTADFGSMENDVHYDE
ncbi:MAG: leucyl/phenylalanyl-tRNA--protein transferase [Chloroflexi bacterium]|nr:leucyl/phenylalanyl-tRNA--protein transferase [Chloroflexota bacterium]